LGYFLSLVSDSARFPEELRRTGKTPPGTRERCQDPDLKYILSQLRWNGAGSVVEHCTCAKLRGTALAVHT
jgi:hypothetical protein